MGTHKAIRMRGGLYTYRGHQIELRDHCAEVYPNMSDYGRWQVKKDTYHGNCGDWDTYATLKEARAAIDEVLNKQQS